MKRIVVILLVSLVSLASFARSKSEVSVGALMVEHDSGSEWLAEDEALFSRLAEALESEKVRIKRQSDFESFFHDPPDPKVHELSSSALEHLKQGWRLSTRLKPRQAIKQFSEALRELRAVFPYLKDLKALEEAHLGRGMTYQALADDASARREYRMVLLLDPDRKLNDAVVSPLVMDVFESVRKNLVASLKGSISVISKPPGAVLSMDGRVVGLTPITVSGVIPGEHYLSLKRPGYKIWFGVLKVPQGSMEKQEVFMAQGSSFEHGRLLGKVASGGGDRNDAESLLTGLGVEQLLLFEFDHVGGKTLVKVTSASHGKEPLALGVFPLDGANFQTLVKKLRRWLAGDHRELLGVGVGVGVGDKGSKPETGIPPVVEEHWYEKWWVWTIAGGVLAGAAAAAAIVWTQGDEGIQIEIYR